MLLIVFGLARTPTQTVAGPALRSQAAQLAAGAPILADAQDAEQLALDGRRVWIANPIDAFDRAEQHRYVDWLRGSAAGDSILRAHDVVLVQVGSPPQERLARKRAYREVARDATAVLYRRAS